MAATTAVAIAALANADAAANGTRFETSPHATSHDSEFGRCLVVRSSDDA
jgi:hypothetical protein